MFRLTILCAGIAAAGVTLLIVLFLTVESGPAVSAVGVVRFLSDPSWHPTADRFNLTPMLFATVGVSAGALAIAAPVGVLCAVFTRFSAPPLLARTQRGLIGVLAGIPSVVFGLWGVTVLVPIVGRIAPPGPSVLAATLILAAMILPTVALLSDAALGAVPSAQLRAAAALGLCRSAVVWKVAIPMARRGLATAVILGAARAIGETMAVLMVCGNVVQMPTSLFDPVRTLTANIALEVAYAMDVHRSALFVTGLVLALLVGGLILLADRVDPGDADDA